MTDEKPKKASNATYSKALVKKFCELLASGKYSIEDCCAQCGMSKQTFYNWKANKIDFLDAYEAAIEQRLDSIAEMALSGLAKKLDVYEYDETKREFEVGNDGKLKPQPVKVTTTKKRVMPSDALIQFALTNRDAAKWRMKTQVDHTNNGETFDFGSFLMSPDALPDTEESETILTDELVLPENKADGAKDSFWIQPE